MQIILLAAALALTAQSGKPEAQPQPQPAPQAQPEPEGDGIGGREMSEEAANLDFIIVNHTGLPADRSAAGLAESWSDNLLHYPEVPDQERAAASYSRDVELCRWDVRVRYQGSGNRQSWPAVNLCDTVRVELR